MTATPSALVNMTPRVVGEASTNQLSDTSFIGRFPAVKADLTVTVIYDNDKIIKIMQILNTKLNT